MSKIAFLLLAHRDPARLIAKAETLTAHGDCVAIHFDRRARARDWRILKSGLAGNPNVTFAKRIRCGWGEYSLVQASLNLIGAARAAFRDITHYYLISGDCYPIKSRGYLGSFLGEDRDYIEGADFFASDWIKTGMKEDRLIYRHWFNERERKQLFYTSLNLQRRFRMSRELPAGVTMRIGSQWWALRAATVEKMLRFLKKRPDIPRFFRTTWIPDETFFQTLVHHLVPADQINDRPPTHLRFSDYGMPVVFHADHADYLRSVNAPFARKVSAHANDLHIDLLDRFGNWDSDAPEGGLSSSLYGYLTGRGRKGERYAPRFWETAIGPRRRVELLIVAAKLWHIGEAIASEASRISGVRNLGYVFDDNRDLGLDLGGLESGVGKRNQHRLALLNLVFDALDEQRLIICLDPCQIDAMNEITRNLGDVRILLVDRPVPDTHIHGHALRTGLISPSSGDFEVREATSSLRHEFRAEIENLRQAHAGRLFCNSLDRERETNLVDIGRFLKMPRTPAEALTREAEKWRN